MRMDIDNNLIIHQFYALFVKKVWNWKVAFINLSFCRRIIFTCSAINLRYAKHWMILWFVILRGTCLFLNREEGFLWSFCCDVGYPLLLVLGEEEYTSVQLHVLCVSAIFQVWQEQYCPISPSCLIWGVRFGIERICGPV